MRIVSRSIIGLTTALALTVVACGDSIVGTDVGVDELTPAEVAAFVDVFFMGFDAAEAEVDSLEAAAAPAQAPEAFDTTFALSVPCESGSGSLDVSGSIDVTSDDVTGDEDGSITVTIDPMACVVGDSTNTFTLDGDGVEIVFEFTVDGDTETETVNGSVKGGFSFESDELSGSCKIDVTVSVVSVGISASVTTVTGTVCGLDADDIEAFKKIGDDGPNQQA